MFRASCAVLLAMVGGGCAAPAVRSDAPTRAIARAPDEPVIAQLASNANAPRRAFDDAPAWSRFAVHTLADVTDVRATQPPLAFAADVAPAELQQLAEWFTDAVDGGGGARSGRAMRKIAATGHTGLCFLVNQLRAIDYTDREQLELAHWIHLTLTDLTMGESVGFVPVEDGPQPQTVDPRLAECDALAACAWLRKVRTQWPTRASFAAFRAQREAERDAELASEQPAAPKPQRR